LATGTYELTGISGALTGGAGLSPRDLTVFNGEGLFPQVLFVGNDASGHIGLWVTDGFDSVAAAARARRTARSLADGKIISRSRGPAKPPPT
jgi:hypothetical protein